MRKAFKDLQVGDIIALTDPESRGRVVRKERSRLFEASGGCWCFDVVITAGKHVGHKIRDQHMVGDNETEVF